MIPLLGAVATAGGISIFGELAVIWRSDQFFKTREDHELRLDGI
jgi:hypothetical protein